MYTLYKEGKEISADRDQLAPLMEDGWVTVKPEVVAEEESDASGADDSEEEVSGNKLESADDDDADPRRLDLE